MAKLTTAQITTLVDGGTILRRLVDGAYQAHEFTGTLNGMSYGCITPAIHDLELDENTSKTDAVAAFKTHFKAEDHKGSAPVQVDETDW